MSIEEPTKYETINTKRFLYFAFRGWS